MGNGEHRAAPRRARRAEHRRPGGRSRLGPRPFHRARGARFRAESRPRQCCSEAGSPLPGHGSDEVARGSFSLAATASPVLLVSLGASRGWVSRAREACGAWPSGPCAIPNPGGSWRGQRPDAQAGCRIVPQGCVSAWNHGLGGVARTPGCRLQGTVMGSRPRGSVFACGHGRFGAVGKPGCLSWVGWACSGSVRRLAFRPLRDPEPRGLVEGPAAGCAGRVPDRAPGVRLRLESRPLRCCSETGVPFRWHVGGHGRHRRPASRFRRGSAPLGHRAWARCCPAPGLPAARATPAPRGGSGGLRTPIRRWTAGPGTGG